MKLALLVVLGVACTASATATSQDNVLIPSLPGDKPIPRVTVSLDDPPATRWNQVMQEGHFDFAPMINYIKNMIPKALYPMLVKLMGDLDAHLGQPYADELRGVAAATGLDLGWVVTYNLFYEITAFCTSIVAQHRNGTIFHGRNLDYGVPGLRNVTIDVSFTKGGKELFRTVTYAGYVGALTGVRGGAFSLSVDERDTEGVLIGALTNAFEALFDGGKSIGFTLRSLLEEQSTFEDALARQTFAEPFFRSSALHCAAVAWSLIPTGCPVVP